MPWHFYLIEISVLLFGLFCFLEAWKTSLKDVMTFIGAAIFGLGIEFAFVTLASGYSYGDFLLSPNIAGHSVPIWVAVGWASIIFAAMKTSDRAGIPWVLRPLFDGLLAISIDFTLDPIAEHLGFWHWHNGGDYYDVPYDNFVGWLMIVGFYSFFTRLGFRFFGSGTKLKDILVPAGAILTSAATILPLQLGLDYLYGIYGQALVFASILGSYLLCLTPYFLGGTTVKPRKWYQTLIPLYFHSLMLVLLFVTGLYIIYPSLIVLFPVMFIVSMFAFGLPKKIPA